MFEQGRELRAGVGVARSAGPIERLLGALQVRLDAGSARQGHPIDITADRRIEIAAAAIEVEGSRRALDEPRLSLEGQVAERDAAEAEQRFFARYGKIVGGNSWAMVQRYLGDNQPKPSTVEGWISVAEAVRDLERGNTSAAVTA